MTLLVALTTVFAAQKFIETRTTIPIPKLGRIENRGTVKLALGVGVSFAFFAVLAELALTGLPRRFIRSEGGKPIRYSPMVLISVFTVLNLQSDGIRGYIACVAEPPSWVTAVGIAVIAGWFVAAWRLSSSVWVEVGGALVLLLLVRIAAYSALPFEQIGGDMLSTIDRSWNFLIRGEFPYIDKPPPAMPYWPGTFLYYGPAKLLGFDYRMMNLLAECGTVLLAACRAPTSFGRLALPTLMLFPAWTYYSAETQYPISVFALMLLGVTILNDGPRLQGFALGFAVAVNQTFGVYGLLLAPYWLQRYGWKVAIGQTALATGICFVFVGPFLCWNADEFLRVTLLSLTPFDSAAFAGRFSWRPLLQSLHQYTPTLAILAVTAATAALNVWKIRSSHTAWIAANLAYCATLLLLHRTFSHYFLPIMAVIALVPSLRSVNQADETSPDVSK